MKRKKAAEVEVSAYKAQAEKAADAAKQAALAAKESAERARDWAAPKVKSAYHSGARKVAPTVHKIGDKAEHWADVAHAAIVGAAIPAAIAAVDRAANHDDEEKSGGLAKVILPVAIIGAAAGAALIMWARRDPQRAAWAGEDEEWELAEDASFAEKLRYNVNKAVDNTIAGSKKVAHEAGVLGAKAQEAAAPAIAKVKDVAGDAADKVKEVATPAISKIKDVSSETFEKVKGGVADSLESFEEAIEDAWDDEALTGEVETVVETVKKGAKAAKDAVK